MAVDVCQHIGQKTFSDAVVSLGLLSEGDLPRGSSDDNDITVVLEASAATSSSSSNILTVRVCVCACVCVCVCVYVCTYCIEGNIDGH